MTALDRFIAATRGILAEEHSPQQTASRARKELLDLIQQPEFLQRDWNIHASPDGPRSTILYEDDDYGFQVLAHVIQAGRYNPPHGHGGSWVLYGVCENTMVLTNYLRLDDGGSQGSARLSEQSRLTLHAGESTAYVPGMIHSTQNPTDGPSILIRVTSADLDTVERESFDLERGTVEPIPATKTTSS